MSGFGWRDLTAERQELGDSCRSASAVANDRSWWKVVESSLAALGRNREKQPFAQNHFDGSGRARREANVLILTEPDPAGDGGRRLTVTSRARLPTQPRRSDCRFRYRGKAGSTASHWSCARFAWEFFIAEQGQQPDPTRPRRTFRSQYSRWGIGTASSRSAAVFGMLERPTPSASRTTFLDTPCSFISGARRSPNLTPIQTGIYQWLIQECGSVMQPASKRIWSA